jgi:stage III sporulation protein AC
MDVGLILKIAGIGLIVAVLNVFLSKNGRDDHANLVSLAGIIIAVVMLVSKLSELIDLIGGVFGIG